MTRGGPKKDRSGRSNSGSRDFDPANHSDKSKRSFDRGSKRRAPGREPKGFKNRRDFESSIVTCASCGVECEVPFKPTSNKPVYCRDCFNKDDKGPSNHQPSTGGISKRDIEQINKKLDKIMEALDID